MMHKGSRGLMTWGAVGALAGIMLIPVLNSKTRKKVSRSARNVYFKAADLMQDVKDMDMMK